MQRATLTIRPRVSIGLPVGDDEASLRQTLTSLLGQTWQRLEIILCDTSMTDAGRKIAQEYVERDSRVRYLPGGRGVGAVGPCNRAIEAAQGDYFMWNPTGRNCPPDFIERCVAAMDADTSLAVVQVADDSAQAGPDSAVHPLRVLQKSAWRRLAKLALPSAHCRVTCLAQSMIRLAWLRHTSGMREHLHAERVLFLELALLGRIGVVDQLPAAVREAAPAQHAPFTRWILVRELLTVVRQTWLAPLQKMMCYATLGVCIVRHAPGMVVDVPLAGAWYAGRALRLLSRPQEWSTSTPAATLNRHADPQLGNAV